MRIKCFFGRLFVAGFFVLFTSSCLFAETGEKVSYSKLFPLKKGSYWIYEGEIKWTSPGAGKVLEKTLTWKMEITEVIERTAVTAAVVKGHPQDLAWYGGDNERGDYLILRSGQSKFYFLETPRAAEVLSRLRDTYDNLVNLVREDELFLDAPLEVSSVFGETAQLTRADQRYCWVVEGVTPFESSGFKGGPIPAAQTQYRLSFRTLPDHVFVDFVPGIGITHYQYSHHGTVAEADIKLVEYFAG